MYPSEPFPHFVDDYLAYLHEALPSQASLDGVHLHDDLLEDLSRSGIDAHVRALAGFGRRLHQIDPALLPRSNRSSIRSSRRTSKPGCTTSRWSGPGTAIHRSTPTTIGTSLAGQALFAYAPEAERARRVVSKLRQVPRLVQAAHDNIKECPGIFVKIGLETWRGVAAVHRDRSAAGVLVARRPAHPRRPRRHLDRGGRRHQGATSTISKTDLAPRAKASFRLGRERFEQKLKLEEGITLSADRLLAIALRELHDVQEEFRSVAGRLNGGDPIEAWRHAKEQHPEPGKLVAAAQEQVKELEEFLRRQAIVSLPDVGAGRRRAVAGVLPLGVCQHVDAGSVREQAKPRLLLPDRRRSRAGRPSGRKSTCGTSTSRRSGTSRFTRSIPATSCTTSICAGRVEGPQVDALRAGVVRRRLGALLRADDGRGRLPPRRRDHPPRTARRSAGAAGALRRRHPPALRGSVGGAGDALLPRRGVPRRSDRATRSRARHVRSRATWCTRSAS